MPVNQDVSFKVKEVLVGKFDYSTEQFAAPVSIPFADGFNSNPQRDSDTKKDDGAEKLFLSVVTGYRPTLKTAGLSPTIAQVFNNVTVATNKVTVNLGDNAPTWGCMVYLQLAQGNYAYWACANNVVETWDPFGESTANEWTEGTLEWMAGTMELADGTLIKPFYEVVDDLTGKPSDQAEFNTIFGITIA